MGGTICFNDLADISRAFGFSGFQMDSKIS